MLTLTFNLGVSPLIPRKPGKPKKIYFRDDEVKEKKQCILYIYTLPWKVG